MARSRGRATNPRNRAGTILVARNGSCPPSGKVPRGWSAAGSRAPPRQPSADCEHGSSHQIARGRHPRTATLTIVAFFVGRSQAAIYCPASAAVHYVGFSVVPTLLEPILAKTWLRALSHCAAILKGSFWRILLQKSKIDQPQKSRES